MKNIKHLILFALLLLAGRCPAQEDTPEFPPDRPGYSWGTEVLPLHHVSWENGFCFESLADGGHAVTLNSTILRYGLFENVELRVGTDFLLCNKGDAVKPFLGINPLTIGTKLKIYESTSWLPSIGLLAEFQSPHIGSKELLPSHLAPSMYVLFEHGIGDRFWLCYNAGLEWDGETATPQTFLSLMLGASLTDALGVFVETYNYLHPEEGHQYLTDFGLNWMITDRLQVDVACDLDFQNFGKYYAIEGGVSWMIH